MSPPEKEAIIEILQIHLKKIPHEDDINVELLANKVKLSKANKIY